MKEGGPIAGGGGAAKPAPTETLLLAKPGNGRATGAIAIWETEERKSAAIAVPAKAQG